MHRLQFLRKCREDEFPETFNPLNNAFLDGESLSPAKEGILVKEIWCIPGADRDHFGILLFPRLNKFLLGILKIPGQPSCIDLTNINRRISIL